MRCSYCGSRNVALITKNEGYSFKKGIAGQILLGPVGAVAGVNGKQKQIYHCSDCGQDQSQPMDLTTEGNINRALQDHNDSMLRTYKQMYHNLEWQETYVPENSDVRIDIVSRLSRIDSKESSRVVEKTNLDYTDTEIKSKVKQILGDNSLPLTLDDICIHLDISENKKDYIIKRKQIDDVVNQMASDGIIHFEKIGEEVYARLPKDLEEMKSWQQESAAMKYDYSPFTDEIKTIIMTCEQVSEADLVSIFKEKHAELLNENSYLPAAIVDNSVNYLMSRNIISKQNNILSGMQDEQLGLKVEQEYLNEYDQIKKRAEATILQEVGTLSESVEIFHYLQKHPGLTEDEIVESKEVLIDISKNKCHAILRAGELNRGLFTEEKDGIKYYYAKDYTSNVYSELFDMDLYKKIVSILKSNETSVSFIDITQTMGDSEKAQIIYNQLKCAEYYGDAVYDFENKKWLYQDAHKKEKETLNEEIAFLTQQIIEENAKLDEIKSNKENRKLSIQSEQFDATEYLSCIKKLESQIKEKERVIPTLGFFKKKEKERLEIEVREDLYALEKVKKEQNDAQKKHQEKITLAVQSIENEEKAIKESIAKLIEKQKEIELQISLLDSISAGENANIEVSLE